MTNEEKLLLAIGEISDDIILEASTPYKQSIINKKSLTIAASIAVVAVGIGILPLALGNAFGNGASGGNSAPEMGGDSSNGSLDIREESFGSLSYHGRLDDNTYSFTLLIMTEASEPIDVTLYSKDDSVVYTTKDVTPDGVIVRRPVITVNGEVQDKLPTEVGAYDITISFDGMEDSADFSTIYEVGIFGYYHRFD